MIHNYLIQFKNGQNDLVRVEMVNASGVLVNLMSFHCMLCGGCCLLYTPAFAGALFLFIIFITS